MDGFNRYKDLSQQDKDAMNEAFAKAQESFGLGYETLSNTGGAPSVGEYVKERVRRAVQEERERCARLVETATILNEWDQKQLAAAIRKGG